MGGMEEMMSREKRVRGSFYLILLHIFETLPTVLQKEF